MVWYYCFFNLPQSCSGSKFMKIAPNFVYFCSYVNINGAIGFSAKKYTSLVYLNVSLEALGVLKTCFGVVPCRSKYGCGPPSYPVYLKNVLKCTRYVYFLELNRMVSFMSVYLHILERYGQFSTFVGGSRLPWKVEYRP